ncbi:hypothetical protein [uncultured Cyclobacterium sp.]|uniref:hypothetical protein n=1 Tax=uncultured Cyclobacterium sp. TaxID=453820 RepID=UPI0030EB19B4
MMQESKKYNGLYVVGLVAILLGSYFSWTIFFIFIAFILYFAGIVLVLLSKKKWWIKLVTILLPLTFTLPTGPMIINFFEGLFS